MKRTLKYSASDEQALFSRILSFKDDPLAFVMFAFPWGKEGTPLAKVNGPRKWQREELEAIRDHIKMNKIREAKGEPLLMYKSATASGRGIGKSALVSMLILWAMSTKLGGTVVVAANTEDQLKNRTWAELGKWKVLAINDHWFELQALSLRPEQWLIDTMEEQLKISSQYYYAAATNWSEENSDRFAGTHNPLGLTVVFDEASGIPGVIWKVTDGVFTEPGHYRFWFAFSNPRRNTGAFFECFHKWRDFWKTRNLDSRTVEGTDKNYLQSMVDQYGGEDQDASKVEVLGQFPSHGDTQFISRSIIEAAATRELEEDYGAPLIMGVDPARHGADATCIFFREGRNARLIAPVTMKQQDNMAVAMKCAEMINKYNPDAICIDAGNGTGIIDRLREMGFRKIHEVWFGAKSSEPEWANRRTEIWSKMREWLRGGCIPNISALLDDLSGPEYVFQGRGDKLMLESKEDMRKRGLASPDYADALACTFAVNVARKDLRSTTRKTEPRMARGVDYDIFG